MYQPAIQSDQQVFPAMGKMNFKTIRYVLAMLLDKRTHAIFPGGNAVDLQTGRGFGNFDQRGFFEPIRFGDCS